VAKDEKRKCTRAERKQVIEIKMMYMLRIMTYYGLSSSIWLIRETSSILTCSFIYVFGRAASIFDM